MQMHIVCMDRCATVSRMLLSEIFLTFEIFRAYVLRDLNGSKVVIKFLVRLLH